MPLGLPLSRPSMPLPRRFQIPSCPLKPTLPAVSVCVMRQQVRWLEEVPNSVVLQLGAACPWPLPGAVTGHLFLSSGRLAWHHHPTATASPFEKPFCCCSHPPRASGDRRRGATTEQPLSLGRLSVGPEMPVTSGPAPCPRQLPSCPLPRRPESLTVATGADDGLCLGLGPGTSCGPSPVSESVVVVVDAGPSPSRALRAPADAGVVDGEAVEGWRRQPGWHQWEESSESSGHVELPGEAPGRVGSEPPSTPAQLTGMSTALPHPGNHSDFGKQKSFP